MKMSTCRVTLNNAQPNVSGVGFQVTEIYSHAAEHAFLVLYLSEKSTPGTYNISQPSTIHYDVSNESAIQELGLVCQMFCERKNDDSDRVTQFLGSAVMDLSTAKHNKNYTLVMRDSSCRPHVRVGQVTLNVTTKLSQALTPLKIQTPNCSRTLYDAAESNLNWIGGFGPRGLDPIVHGLKLVHSPYYVNHMGVTLPSGAFCMIPFGHNNKKKEALQSYRDRLKVALARNVMQPEYFCSVIHDLHNNISIKSRHLRCLSVVADALTLHARLDIHYTPDVILLPKPKGTERWEIPREPAMDDTLSFTGDCEDFAREVYQHSKEMREWVEPKLSNDPLECMVAVLHLYVPTIEQGAVDSSAHSKYITYAAEYRNHIWAALHPRSHWKNKCTNNFSMNSLYEKWPERVCENTLPLLHLEGTGEVYPVVTHRKPGYISKLQHKKDVLEDNYPQLTRMYTPDMALQCNHSSTFYKYDIACMTDVFKDQGVIDYTYVTKNKYGVPIYDWARGKYKFRPSATHSKQTMECISHMMTLERPIRPILTTSEIIKAPTIKEGYFLRYGQKTPIYNVPKDAISAEYRVGEAKWYELYFHVDTFLGTSSEGEI